MKKRLEEEVEENEGQRRKHQNINSLDVFAD
jgi:hypothetical protein